MAGVFSRVSQTDPPMTDRDEFKKLIANVHKDFPAWRAELAGDTSSAEDSLRTIFGKDRDKVVALRWDQSRSNVLRQWQPSSASLSILRRHG
jgi:hypothetical protein